MRWIQAVAFVALFFVQVLPAATVAVQQARRLATGRPILLAVETRDPRDLFRGEYSTLTYEIGDPNGIEVVGPLPGACDLTASKECPLRSNAVYVRLVPDAAGIDRAKQVTFARPPDGDLFIAGRTTWANLIRNGEPLPRSGACAVPVCLTGRLTFGIESWYGAQGKPALLDAAARKDALVEARVGKDGIAVLDEIRVGGQTFAKTPRLWPLDE